MIVEVNEATLCSIRNPVLRAYAEEYVKNYQDFMQQVRQMGMKVEETDQSQYVRQRIAALGQRGAVIRNDSKSVYLNRLSPACQACQTGVGSLTLSTSLKCHRHCFFCFNPNEKSYEYWREHKHDTVAELDNLHARGQRLQHLALTGGEPLLYKKETVQFFQHARQIYPDAYTRLYTCGDHLERETLQALKDADLNEIRISIRIEDFEKAQRHTLDQIALAQNYVPNVMVEMPVLPCALDPMKRILSHLDELGIFGINLLELCYPFHNTEEYRNRGYCIKARPFRALYNYSTYPGGLPVAGSERTCLDLIEFALQRGLRLGVHYCSVENRNSAQVYEQNTQSSIPGVLYLSHRDYFLKSAKVFGDDVAGVKTIFDHDGYHGYHLNHEHGFLEFNVNKINMLLRLDVEVGISTNILEKRNGKTRLHEVKVDVTTPQNFRFSDL
jgi:pyruvate formate-lyase activating enzyme-like uncharacterized protein